MKALYKLHFDCGRQGELNGLFICDTEKLEQLVKSEYEVYFGEALGKHSEVYGKIEECDYTLVSTDDNVIKVIEENNLENGYNPFDYIDAEEYQEYLNENK